MRLNRKKGEIQSWQRREQPVLVVLQLSGGNDYLNTVIPYANSLYWENRPAVSIPEDQIIPIDQALGFPPQHGSPEAVLRRR